MSNTTKKKKNYVNNKELYEHLLVYLDAVDDWKKAGEEGPKPKVSDYIATSIIKIAEGLAHRPNFSGYTFKDDMIGDGIENCIAYIDNYKRTATNPFAYFTQIIWYAFIRRINKEKKQTYIKYKSISNSEVFSVQDGDDSEYTNTYTEFMQKEMEDKINDFEEGQRKKKEKRKKKLAENTLDSVL